MLVGKLLKGASDAAQKRKKKKSSKISEEIGAIATKQEEQLAKLLSKAKKTEFGEKYNFQDILNGGNVRESFRQNVPIYQYDSMFQEFWHKTLDGCDDVSWPGKISNFALTSGTTSSSSKRVPVSKQMIKCIKKICLRQVLTLSELDMPPTFYEKDILMVGGSTELTKINKQWEGDLSGILTGKVPHWLTPYSKPKKKIKALSDWEEKLEKMVENAPKWDVGMVCGVPAWVQILIHRIIEQYELETIFDMWPNLRVYIHGGVQFSPYEQSFNELFQGKVMYLDSYLASEGFIGFQHSQGEWLELVINNYIYYEFVPFDADNFTEEGIIKDSAEALTIDEIDEEVEYALLISTNSGAFRYLIGDTVQFIDVAKLQFKITGRTQHFLSICGEHLSVDNMTQAITDLSFKEGMAIDEFAVFGRQLDNGNFMHRWFVSSDKLIDASAFLNNLDVKLTELNDDYKTERKFGLERLSITILPPQVFYDFMKKIGKLGSQHKFPRVMKGKLADDWENHVKEIEVAQNQSFAKAEIGKLSS